MFITCTPVWDADQHKTVLEFVSAYDKIENALEKLSDEEPEFCFEIINGGDFYQCLGEMEENEDGYDIFRLKYYFRPMSFSPLRYRYELAGHTIDPMFQYQLQGERWVDNHIYIGERIGIKSEWVMVGIKFIPERFCEAVELNENY